MAQTIDTELLEKERERLTTSLAEARTNLELIKNQIQQLSGAIGMTDRLIELHKKGNYSKARANSEQENPENAAEIQKELEES
jgi:uncharacterized membrane protein YgaE (UPF0421/DUF939 family)